MSQIIAWFLSVFAAIAALFPGIFGGTNVNENYDEKVLPETWAAVDGLGRTLSMSDDVGEKDDSKFVGMFYWIWHENFTGFEAMNVNEIITEYPEALHDWNHSAWLGRADGVPHYWDEPLFGYYSDLDEYVLRKHAEMIADAGVDVIIFDCTNGTQTWDNCAEQLFRIFEEAKEDGVNVPQIAYILPFDDGEDTTTSLKNLYENIYSKGRYRDLWFMWDGKPLIMAHKSGLDRCDEEEKAIYDFFTFRENKPAYFDDDYWYSQKSWGWCSVYPQTKFGKSLNGDVEEMCVSVAQNACDGELCAMNAYGDVQGRSHTEGDYSYSYTYGGKEITVDKNIENSTYYGLNFQQQWDYAIECDPDFIFVTGWNEWIAGRYEEWQGTENAFPDQCCDEYSRDIEPSAGDLKDYYYYQLVENIRRFKGISEETEEVDGVKNYYHYTDSTYKRDCHGWAGLYYTSDTMRNDFVRASVSNDDNYIYLEIETEDNITPYTDNAWMRVFIDTDKTGCSPSWEGFEYVINREGATEDKVIIEKSDGGWNFTKCGEAEYTVNGNIMKIKIPVSALGLEDDISFNFKLSDNMQTDGDILDFYKSGDVAPGGRFTFVY